MPRRYETVCEFALEKPWQVKSWAQDQYLVEHLEAGSERSAGGATKVSVVKGTSRGDDL